MQLQWPDLHFGPINLLSMPRTLDAYPGSDDPVIGELPTGSLKPSSDALAGGENNLRAEHDIGKGGGIRTHEFLAQNQAA